jgi:hypothetical protein
VITTDTMRASSAPLYGRRSAWFGVRRGQFWAWVTAVAVPVLALAVALPAHYPNHLDTFGHLGLIYADTLLFVIGAAVAFLGLRELSA